MRRSELFWATVLILAGALFLLNNFGILRVSWDLMWPLFLILLGAWILFARLLGPRTMPSEEVSVPLEGARQAHVRMDYGAGRLNLRGRSGPGELVSGTFGGGLDYHTRREGEALNLRMRPPSDPFFWMMPWNWGTRGMGWDFSLNGDIPLSIEFKGGASENLLDLEDLKVTDLRIETGASSTVVTLPASAGLTHARMNAGAAALEIKVPPGVAARIDIQSGLSGIDVDTTRFPKSGGVYKSVDYETAENKADLRIEAGVGSIRIY